MIGNLALAFVMRILALDRTSSEGGRGERMIDAKAVEATPFEPCAFLYSFIPASGAPPDPELAASGAVAVRH